MSDMTVKKQLILTPCFSPFPTAEAPSSSVQPQRGANETRNEVGNAKTEYEEITR